MERHIKPVVVDFQPPVTDGQQEWEQRLAAQLQPYLPADQDEAREITSIMQMIVDGSEEQQAWQRWRLACYILGMFPEDRAAALRLVSLLSCLVGGGA